MPIMGLQFPTSPRFQLLETEEQKEGALIPCVKDGLPAKMSYAGLTGGGGGDVPTGTVLLYMGSTAPDGFFLCDGSTFDDSENPVLYSLLGTTTLPDFAGRSPAGLETGKSLGETYGEKEHTLTVDEMPSHNHTLQAYNSSYSGYANGVKQSYYTHNQVTTDYAGGGLAHNNEGRRLSINFIIKGG
jgi:microcystin-dependent protein